VVQSIGHIIWNATCEVGALDQEVFIFLHDFEETGDMSAIKQSLHSTIESLSEEEARRVLELIQQLRAKERGISQTIKRLSADPSFEIPPKVHRAFHPVEPVRGKGTAASKLLVEDRR
jgi:hydrogenase maturation factor